MQSESPKGWGPMVEGIQQQLGVALVVKVAEKVFLAEKSPVH